MWSLPDGSPLRYSDVQRYLRTTPVFELATGDTLNPTDLRKLKAATVFWRALQGRRRELGEAVLEVRARAAGDVREQIAAAVSTALEEALEQAREALNHKEVATTVAAYLVPDVLLRFLATADLDTDILQALQEGANAVAFDPEAFLEAAAAWAAGRTPNGPLLQFYRER